MHLRPEKVGRCSTKLVGQCIKIWIIFWTINYLLTQGFFYQTIKIIACFLQLCEVCGSVGGGLHLGSLLHLYMLWKIYLCWRYIFSNLRKQITRFSSRGSRSILGESESEDRAGIEDWIWVAPLYVELYETTKLKLLRSELVRSYAVITRTT